MLRYPAPGFLLIPPPEMVQWTTRVPGGTRVPPVPERQIAGFLMSHSLGHLPLDFPIMPDIMSGARTGLQCPPCGNPCDP